MKKWIITVIPMLAVFLPGCGEGSPAEGEENVHGPDTLDVFPSDTIGILMGDSNFVFGTIGDAVYTRSGNIAVLDEAACCVKVYDPDGGFLRRIGRQGSGPGEMLNPGGLILLSNGSLGILDAPTGGLHCFSEDGTFQGLLIDFQGQPMPQWAWGADSMAFVAAYTTTSMEEDGMTSSFVIGRWENSFQPAVTYVENSFPFDPEDMAAFLNNTFFSAAFAADRGGSVYVAGISSDEYRIDVLDAEGNPVSVIERDMPRVRKTPGEIQEETEMISAILRERGVPDYMIDYQPDPYRWTIQPQGLGADGRNRIWVRNGAADGVVLDVYAHDGQHLAVIRVGGVMNTEITDFVNVKVQPQGLLAYSLQDPEYPRLYVIPMPEF